MRKFLAVLALASMSLVVSCSGGNGPEGVAEKFVTHTSKGEFAEAKKYCTESTAALIGMAEAFAGDKVNEMKEKNKDIKVNIISSEVKDSIATVKYKVTGGEADSGEKSLDLVKDGEEWKVNVNKEGGTGSEVPAE